MPAVASFLTTGSSVVADIFPPEQRGAANGMFMIPLLFGPILGPLIGGAIAQAFGWRSTFITLIVLGGAILLPLVAVFVPETQQYRILMRMHALDPSAALAMKENEEILNEPPVFHAPWVPLKYIVEPEITPHVIVLLITFGAMFASLTEFPVMMAAEPYNLSATMIGVAYLPMGVAGLVGSPIGGMLSDHTAAAHPDEPEARLIHNTALTLLFMGPGLLLFGWSLQYTTALAAPLIGHFMIGIASAFYLPGIFGYISTLKQSAAGAACGMVQAMMFMSAGVLIIVSSIVVNAIGMGPFFSILAGCHATVTAVAYVLIWRKRRSSMVRAANVGGGLSSHGGHAA